MTFAVGSNGVSDRTVCYQTVQRKQILREAQVIEVMTADQINRKDSQLMVGFLRLASDIVH